MTIEQLNSIIEIAETGSFSKAAKKLHTSQPNLSYVVRILEEQMGSDIFFRTSDGVFLTEAGKELITQLKFLKNDYSLVNEILTNKYNQITKLSFSISTLNMFSLRTLFSEITTKYQNVPINFSLYDYSNFNDVIKHIGDVDFSIVGMINTYINHLKTDLYNLSIEYHPVAMLSGCAIIGKNNSLFDSDIKEITIEELTKHTLLQYIEDPENPQQSLVHALGISKQSFGKVVVNSTDAFYNILQHSQLIGIDFVSLNKFSELNNLNSIKILPIKNCPFTWEVAWIKKRQYPLSDIGSEFIEKLKNAF